MSNFFNSTNFTQASHPNFTPNAEPSTSRKATYETPMSFYVTLIFTGVLILGLNSYVLTIFCRARKVRSKSNIPLISLALSDIQSGLINIPLLLAAHLLYDKGHPYSFTVVLLGDIATILCAATTMSSLFLIVAIRYLSVCSPITYFVVKRSQIRLSVVTVWFLSYFFSLIRLHWLLPLFTTRSKQLELIVKESDKIYYIVSITLYATVVLCLISLFSHMFFAIQSKGSFVRKHRWSGSSASTSMKRNSSLSSSQKSTNGSSFYLCKERALVSSMNGSTISRWNFSFSKNGDKVSASKQDGNGNIKTKPNGRNLLKRDIKVTLLFTAMFICFLISFTPLAVLRLLIAIDTDRYTRVPQIILRIIIVLRFVTSVINPIIYTLFKADVQMACSEDFHRVSLRLKRKMESDSDHLLTGEACTNLPDSKRSNQTYR